MNDKMTYRKRGDLWIIYYQNANAKSELVAFKEDNNFNLELSIINIKPKDEILVSMVLQMVYRISKTKKKHIILSFPTLNCAHLESQFKEYGFKIIDRKSEIIIMDKYLDGHHEMQTPTANFPFFEKEPKFGQNKIVVYNINHVIQDKTFFTPPIFEQKGDIKIFFSNQFMFKKSLVIPRNDLKKGDIVLILRTVKWNGIYNDEVTTISTINKVYKKGIDYNSFNSFLNLFNHSMPLKRKDLQTYYDSYDQVYEVIIQERFFKSNRINKFFLYRKNILKPTKSIISNELTSSQLRYILEYCK